MPAVINTLIAALINAAESFLFGLFDDLLPGPWVDEDFIRGETPYVD